MKFGQGICVLRRESFAAVFSSITSNSCFSKLIQTFVPALCSVIRACARVSARTRARRPALASCPCLRVALLSLPLPGNVPYEGVIRRENEKKKQGVKKKGKETRVRMQMQSPSRLQICKCGCLCDMQMRDYRALIRVKRTVHVN